jgi:hypothetical protein
LAAGCTGEVIGGSAERDGDGRDPNGAGYGADVGGLSDAPAPSTRFARLTHSQWENTVRDLFGLGPETDFSSSFRDDPAAQGFMFKNDFGTLEVDEILWKAYQGAANQVAAAVFDSPAAVAKILPPEGSDSSETARQFISEFGSKVYRRPLEANEIAEYAALHASAAELYPELAPFAAGARLVIEAMLQSPHFLYRVETSSERSADVIPLNGYEIASRLSYMLWDTMPDDTLFALAKSGDLTRADVAAEQAERLLEDPRSKAVITSFHTQLLDHDRYAAISPSAAFFPGFTAELAGYAKEESERFLADVIFARGGSYRDMLTSTDTFVNADLAKIYGLTGSFSTEFERVTLDPAQRRGFLTQVGFLASHATSVNPDPIHRGVFLADRILCMQIAAPPGDIPPLPPPDNSSNRQVVERHTEAPGSQCANCHSGLINPLGFPFEQFDAIGKYRTDDNGHPVDATAKPLIDGEPTPVDGAVQLIDTLASSEAAHECYTRHWIEFAYGRHKKPEDAALISRLGARSAKGELSIKQLIVGLVKTESFMTRSAKELP